MPNVLTLSDPLRLDGKTSSSSPGGQAAILKFSPRQQTVMEFFQTEKNYTAILHTIIKVQKSYVTRIWFLSLRSWGVGHLA